MDLSPDGTLRALAHTLKRDVHQEGDDYAFRSLNEELPLKLPRQRLEELSESLREFEIIGGAAVANRTTYEAAVGLARPQLGRRYRQDALSIDDLQAGLIYRIGSASIEYVACASSHLEQIGGPSLYIARYAIQEGSDALKALMKAVPFVTLRIESNASRAYSYWQPYAESFLFHLGYNLDIAVMPESRFEDLAGPSRIQSMRRSSPGDLDAPRRHYVSDLVHHYRLGVSAESPMLEYLSYYHVAEHHFENVYHDDLIAKVQNLITSPGFSHRRKHDVQSLIRNVTKAVQLRDGELGINSEESALNLTLQKYVDLTELWNDLAGYDSDLVKHYSEHKVSFAEAGIVNLTAADKVASFKALASRIYKTRNALVHSKEGGKAKFTPFADDSELRREIPLMRFIAERIIIATSRLPAS
jgi:hypothetical protein